MATIEAGLTKIQKSLLKKCVRTVRDGLRTFVEVGNALATIRDERLYLDTHKTFDAFCQDEFDIKRQRAYQLIDEAKVVSNVQNFGHGDVDPPTTASHAAALAELPPEEQAEVWEEVVETTATPTAAAIKGVVEQRKAEKPESSPTAKNLSESEAEATAAIESAEPGRVLLNSIRGAMKQLRALPASKGLELINSRKASILSSLETAANAVSVYLPAGVCPRCKGKGCAQCGNFGWVNKIAKQQLEK